MNNNLRIKEILREKKLSITDLSKEMDINK